MALLVFWINTVLAKYQYTVNGIHNGRALYTDGHGNLMTTIGGGETASPPP